MGPLLRIFSSFVEAAQELGLEVEGQLANLFEKERPFAGLAELPGPGRRGAGEGSLDMTEELGFDEVRVDRIAEERDEGLTLAGALLVNRARELGLARPGLPEQEDVFVPRRHLFELPEERAHHDRFSHDVPEAILLGQLDNPGLAGQFDAQRGPSEAHLRPGLQHDLPHLDRPDARPVLAPAIAEDDPLRRDPQLAMPSGHAAVGQRQVRLVGVPAHDERLGPERLRPLRTVAVAHDHAPRRHARAARRDLGQRESLP